MYHFHFIMFVPKYHRWSPLVAQSCLPPPPSLAPHPSCELVKVDSVRNSVSSGQAFGHRHKSQIAFTFFKKGDARLWICIPPADKISDSETGALQAIVEFQIMGMGTYVFDHNYFWRVCSEMCGEGICGGEDGKVVWWWCWWWRRKSLWGIFSLSTTKTRIMECNCEGKRQCRCKFSLQSRIIFEIKEKKIITMKNWKQ